MTDTLTKIKQVANNPQSRWLEQATERQQNKSWQKRSFQIAVLILKELRIQKSKNGMTQKKFAERMGVSPQYVNKLLKGKENLTLETITKIEEVLDITLIEVAKSASSTTIENNQFSDYVCSHDAVNISSTKKIYLDNYSDITGTNG